MFYICIQYYEEIKRRWGPSEGQYQLANNSAGDTISWSAAKTAPWLEVDPGNGALSPGGSETVEVTLSPIA